MRRGGARQKTSRARVRRAYIPCGVVRVNLRLVGELLKAVRRGHLYKGRNALRLSRRVCRVGAPAPRGLCEGDAWPRRAVRADCTCGRRFVATALPIAFGNQTISDAEPWEEPAETHGFASLPRDRFALIVCNHFKERGRLIRATRFLP